MLGLVYKNKGDHQKALENFKKSLALNDKHALSVYGIGLIYRDQNKMD